MAAADQAAVDSGTSVEVLMDRAGRAVARTAIEMMGGRYGRKVAIVCGTGNNGGDGFVAARVLDAEGVGVRCLVVGDIASATGAARHHLEMTRGRGVPVEPFEAGKLRGADLIVDALFGTGFRDSVDGTAADAVRSINASTAAVLSVDIPSGLDGVRGVTGSVHVIADTTLALAAEKIGTFLSPPDVVGIVDVADIGIEVQGSSAGVVQAADVSAWLPPFDVVSHKRSRGALAILAGADEMTGAAALVVRGALRAGCGYVMLGCTQRVATIVQESCPEAIVYVVSDDDHLGPSALDEFRPALAKATAIALGPGLGRGDDQTKLIGRVLMETQLPIVLDADGLNALQGSTDVLAERDERVVITPHPAELARLTGATVEAIQQDRLSAALAASKSFQCEVLLKGYRSIIATPGGIAHMNPTGGPQLATAGTGDVLTGIVGALLAADNEHALQAAAYLHGLAGDLAGDQGVVAWDVAEGLPEVFDLVHEGLSL